MRKSTKLVRLILLVFSWSCTPLSPIVVDEQPLPPLTATSSSPTPSNERNSTENIADNSEEAQIDELSALLAEGVPRVSPSLQPAKNVIETSQLSFTYPQNNSSTSLGSTLIIKGLLKEVTKPISKVELWQNQKPLTSKDGQFTLGNPKQIIKAANFSLLWSTDSLSTGDYELQLIARDLEGKILLKSSPITVTIALKSGTSSTAVSPPSSVIAAGNIIYVNHAAAGANNGSNWVDAFTSLSAALSVATAGQQVWVAAGTYKPSSTPDKNATFTLNSGVQVFGGFAGGETALAQRNFAIHVVVLDGDILGDGNGPGSNTDNPYHVVTANNNSTIDGFTIQNGVANGAGSDGQGGGMYVNNAVVTVGNVIFQNNDGQGGGLFVSGAASAGTIIANSSFNNNSSSSDGGGMFTQNGANPILNSVTFTSNTAANTGGGMSNLNSSPNLTIVTFTSNTVTTGAAGGGAIHNDNSSPTLTSCNFVSNSAALASGGAIFNDNNSSPTLNNVTFNTNSAVSGGAMINDNSSPPIVSNTTFTSNNATTGDGGAIYNDGASNGSYTDVTFMSNTAANDGGGFYNRNSASSPAFLRVKFDTNTATAGDGGGMFNDGVASVPTLQNIDFINNTAASNGGGLFNNNAAITIDSTAFISNLANRGGGMYNSFANVNVENSIFYVNSANFDGAGLTLDAAGNTTTIINSTFNQNSATVNGGAIARFNNSALVLKNTILSNNGAVAGTEIWSNAAGSTITIDDSLIEGVNLPVTTCPGACGNIVVGGPAPTGANNKTASPNFVNAANHLGVDGVLRTIDDGLRLQGGSPALDGGGLPGPANGKNIIGNTRPPGVAGTIDIGAYEQ